MSRSHVIPQSAPVKAHVGGTPGHVYYPQAIHNYQQVSNLDIELHVLVNADLDLQDMLFQWNRVLSSWGNYDLEVAVHETPVNLM